MTDQPPTPTKSDHFLESLWNFLSGLLVVGIIAAILGIVLIYLNPRSTFNPFPPPTPIPTVLAPTLQPLPTAALKSSPTPLVMQSTAQPTPTKPDQPTPTAILSTPIGGFSSPTFTPTARNNSTYAFIPQSDPKAIDASLFSPGRGCQWMGVAGQAFDIKNSPVPLGIEVQLAGLLDGKPLLTTSLTGTATLYGASGYEITLAEKPVASKSSLWIRLLDQAGLPLSDRIYFDTFADCSKNLIIINFKQVK